MRLRDTIRLVLAVTALICVLALLLMPSTISAMNVPATSHGKQLVRVVSLLTMVVLIAHMCCGVLRCSGSLFGRSWQVHPHGYGPNLLEVTCARLC
ncbi:MAG TPA: hypothetical protein VN577_00820 [Terriglobales bacterium]|nr:hypothetical protein [Terriglobales bacterium]